MQLDVFWCQRLLLIYSTEWHRWKHLHGTGSIYRYRKRMLGVRNISTNKHLKYHDASRDNADHFEDDRSSYQHIKHPHPSRDTLSHVCAVISWGTSRTTIGPTSEQTWMAKCLFTSRIPDCTQLRYKLILYVIFCWQFSYKCIQTLRGKWSAIFAI